MKKEKKDRVPVTITLDKSLFERLEGALDHYPYLTRTAFIATALVAFLDKIEKKEEVKDDPF